MSKFLLNSPIFPFRHLIDRETITRLIRILWLVVLVLALVIFAVGLSAWYPRLLEICGGTQQACQEQGRVTAIEAQRLAEQGWSLEAYARYNLLTRVAQKMLGIALGLVIFWWQPVSLMSVVASLFLVVGLEGSVNEVMEMTYPSWWLLTSGLTFIGGITFNLFFFIFPSGRFIPGWTRWAAGLWALIFFFPTFLPESIFSINNWSPAKAAPLVFVLMISNIIAQIYRYRRVSTPLQRVQTRWVVFTSVVSLLFILAAITQVLNQNSGVDGRFMKNWILVDLAFQQFSFLVPIAIAMSVMRYRLWDIDVIIRRTLVYGTLTALLVLVYLGIVTVLQNLFIAMSGQSSPLSIVLSTLLIAALFNPLRMRIQDFIDRRFYRRKYNAEQAMASFSALARSETDLDQLAAALLGLANETVQPEHASLWLKSDPSSQSVS